MKLRTIMGSLILATGFFSTLAALGATSAVEQLQVNNSDASVLVYVPLGTFVMGGPGSDGYVEPDMEPLPERIELPGYYIGKYAVSNKQYRAFVAATGYRPEGPWETSARIWGENVPVVNITHGDALAYCRWAGVRLPTEAEWERAARGDCGQIFPWGDQWDPARVRCNPNKPLGVVLGQDNSDGKGPASVDDFQSDISPFGCVQMVGNVSEWCSPAQPVDAEGPFPLRGGNWRLESELSVFFQPNLKKKSNSTKYSDTVGFRVAKSVDE